MDHTERGGSSLRGQHQTHHLHSPEPSIRSKHIELIERYQKLKQLNNTSYSTYLQPATHNENKQSRTRHLPNPFGKLARHIRKMSDNLRVPGLQTGLQARFEHGAAPLSPIPEILTADIEKATTLEAALNDRNEKVQLLITGIESIVKATALDFLAAKNLNRLPRSHQLVDLLVYTRENIDQITFAGLPEGKEMKAYATGLWESMNLLLAQKHGDPPARKVYELEDVAQLLLGYLDASPERKDDWEEIKKSVRRVCGQRGPWKVMVGEPL